MKNIRDKILKDADLTSVGKEMQASLVNQAQLELLDKYVPGILGGLLASQEADIADPDSAVDHLVKRAFEIAKIAIKARREAVK